MKNLILILVFSIALKPLITAQIDDNLLAIELLFDQQKYDEIIQYKSRKIKSFSSKVLYYKGLAYFNKVDDKNAYRFFDLAVKKGPADEGMYFYRGFSLFYLKKYNEALVDFKYVIELNPTEPNTYGLVGETFLLQNKPDSAIVYFTKAIHLPNCDIRAYLALADIYQQQEKYEDALAAYQSALINLEPHEEQYKLCAYNIGLIQQLLDRFEDAQKTFESYINIYSDDYQAISKLIQVYYQRLELDKSIDLKEILYKAYSNRMLPSQMKQMFCFDQFKWQDKQVLAFENFDENSEGLYICKHKFYILGNKGNIEFIIRSEKDTLAALNQGDSAYMLKMIKNDTLSIYHNYSYNTEFEYLKLKNATLDILNNKVKPIIVLGGYNKINSAKRAFNNKLSLLEKDGSSFKNAVIVNNISEEYEWLGQYYPGYKLIQQSLMYDKKQPFDVLDIKTIDGESIIVYFDISLFFGKEY